MFFVMKVQMIPDFTNAFFLGVAESNLYVNRLRRSNIITIRGYSYTIVVKIVIIRVIVSIIYAMFLHHRFNLIYSFFYRRRGIKSSSFRRSAVHVVDQRFLLYFNLRLLADFCKVICNSTIFTVLFTCWTALTRTGQTNVNTIRAICRSHKIVRC